MISGSTSVVSRFEYSYTSVQMSLNRTTSYRTPANQTSAPSSRDTVSLSPAATQTPPGDPTAPPTSVGGTSPDPASTSPRSSLTQRAEALFRALDADEDGAISEQEFVEGARSLLRRARPEHDGHVRGKGHGYGRHWGRKLEKVFDRVDGDGNGSVTKEELTRALSATRGSEPAPTTVSSSSVTVVSVSISVAVQRYEALQRTAPTAAPDGATASAVSPVRSVS